MPKAKTVCVEISELHCEVLKAKGYYVECADFLKYQPVGKYDRIVMNPPYSEGRWQAHIERAASMLKLGGRLVAVLPASAKGKDVLPGLKHEWSKIYSNEFAGTSVSVVILAAGA
nr:class I SAM-dependent methyltransferase [Pseudomonas fragi]